MCDSGLSGEGLSSADPLNCTIRRDNTEYLVLPTYVQSTASIGPRTLVPTDMDGRDSEPHLEDQGGEVWRQEPHGAILV